MIGCACSKQVEMQKYSIIAYKDSICFSIQTESNSALLPNKSVSVSQLESKASRVHRRQQHRENKWRGENVLSQNRPAAKNAKN